MVRRNTPSFVVELPLDTDASDLRRLNGVLDAGKRLNNVMLQEGRAIVQAIRDDPAWDLARKLPKPRKSDVDAAAVNQARRDAFGALRKAHGFTEAAFHARMQVHRNASGLGDRIGSDPAQKIASKVYSALEQHLVGVRGQPRFKGIKRPLHSIEGKAQRGRHMFWSEDDCCLYLAPDWAIKAVLPDLRKDEWLWSALQAPTKYCRLVWRDVRGERRWFVQLIQEGLVPIKASLLAKLIDAPGGSNAGLDIGPSMIAWCTETDAGAYRFCADLDNPAKLLKRLQRQVDRQRRANNPENFDAQGRALRGKTWVRSKRQATTEGQVGSLHTHLAARRANAHGRDINGLLSSARHFRHDGVSVKSLQRNCGASVGVRAPGRFMSELERKAERAGGSSTTISVRQLKTSQYDHSTDNFLKKSLSERWHRFGDGRGRVHRDVYSAFLALHAPRVPDAGGGWSHDPKALESAWIALAPALGAKGLFIPSESPGT